MSGLPDRWNYPSGKRFHSHAPVQPERSRGIIDFHFEFDMRRAALPKTFKRMQE